MPEQQILIHFHADTKSVHRLWEAGILQCYSPLWYLLCAIDKPRVSWELWAGIELYLVLLTEISVPTGNLRSEILTLDNFRARKYSLYVHEWQKEFLRTKRPSHSQSQMADIRITSPPLQQQNTKTKAGDGNSDVTPRAKTAWVLRLCLALLDSTKISIIHLLLNEVP